MNPITYVLAGTPIPLARPRFANGRCFDSQFAEKNDNRMDIYRQHGKQPSYQGPLRIEFRFFFPFKESLTQAQRDELAFTSHVFVPDLSNLIKFYEDICTGILYKDDRSIAEIVAFKRYDHIPRTEFTITELPR